MILRLLFRLFRKQFTHYALSEVNKPSGFSDMEIAFTDSNGKRYYRYTDEFDMPIERKARLEQVGQQLRYMLSDTELTKFLSNVDSIIERVVYEKKPGALADLATLSKEVRARKEMLINKEIYYELLAAIYIREDELPGKVDLSIEEQKRKQFEGEAAKQSDLYFFFDSLKLGDYISYFKKLRDNWDTQMTTDTRKLREANKIMDWLTSGRKLQNQENGGKKQKLQ